MSRDEDRTTTSATEILVATVRSVDPEAATPGVVVRAQFRRARDQNLATSIEVKAEEGGP